MNGDKQTVLLGVDFRSAPNPFYTPFTPPFRSVGRHAHAGRQGSNGKQAFPALMVELTDHCAGKKEMRQLDEKRMMKQVFCYVCVRRAL